MLRHAPMYRALRTPHAKRVVRCIACAALLTGGAVFADVAGPGTPGGPDPGGASVDAPMLRSASSPSVAQERPAVPSGAAEQVGPSVPAAVPVETRPTVSSGPSSTVQPGEPAKDEGLVESMHESLSYGFLASATWLDSFFGNERYEAEANQSQFKVRFDAFREGQTGMDYRKPDYTLRLVLPQLRKKTRLVIAGDPNVDTESTTATTPPVPPATQPQPITSKNVAGSVQYFPVETNRSNFSIRAGLKLRYTKLSGQIGPRYRYLIPLDPWALRFTQEVIWSSDQKWSTRTTVDFERPLAGGLFFRTTLEGVWTENINGYPYALGLTLRQPLDPNRALLYSWISSFQTSPTNELVQETFVFGFRQRFWKPWLFLEIDPEVRYPRDRGFAYTPGILFRLEMVFGEYSSFF